ncbi:MAG: hypothetical protein K5655_01150 [Lachnospiraceae bacterium]|nr:hypothetical protein [Lachnospiraceae bacterium]
MILEYAPPLAVLEEEIEDAKANGFVVMRGMEPPYGRELMDEFMEKVERGETAKVRIAKAYDISENITASQ